MAEPGGHTSCFHTKRDGNTRARIRSLTVLAGVWLKDAMSAKVWEAVALIPSRMMIEFLTSPGIGTFGLYLKQVGPFWGTEG